MLEIREKLEKIFVERAKVIVEKKLEGKTLGEMLFHALMECGSECELMAV